MVFKCQEDSFLQEFTSKVLSCEKSVATLVIDGNKQKIEGYDVIMEDTILFPEGGGQPYDTGFINDAEVLQVLRKGSKAIHFVKTPVEVNSNALQKINWERRLDHMQQHSGQHLLSAVLESKFGYSTLAWWLGENVAYIELDTKQVTEDQKNEVEAILNKYIRENLPVKVLVYEKDDPRINDATRNGKTLPADHEGAVRLIEIAGVDLNPCCGTHVSALGQLQAIKLLGAEKGKQGRVNLNFLVGGRVLKYLQNCLERENSMTEILKGGPRSHPDLAQKLLTSQKTASKNLNACLKYIAKLEAEKLLAATPRPKYYSLHNSEAADFPDFMNCFIKEVNSTDILLLLTVGCDKGAGNMVLFGPEELVMELGPKICELLNGKGAGKGNKYQAKVNNLKNRQTCLNLIASKFEV
ncbi:alanyl-tRNA editing protein Aarsd1-B isoform X1 [Ctenocephalides felis]|uniref:alanyl-tRNA editing protein Aarsd1-B isoform X1 n=1 Tax=Ctenocephalides felis TaxID=7515 RepID=UPI000E6E5B2C|nr:alanyl-tRNA editing protein Aarsd1-B isoform X1 [Ctenocephalides felis]